MKTSHENIWRGAEEVIGIEALSKKLSGRKKLRIKHGIDPTNKDLHLGYAVNYRVLRRFQDLGHTVIFLIGDFTTRIGDPTDKDKTRPELTPQEIKRNVASVLKQVKKILDPQRLEIRHNSEWWDEASFLDFMQIARRISAVRLWERDMFRKRLEMKRPIFVHEFLYPIMQGYDSVMLKSDATVVGTDQIFNELMGRELQVWKKQEPQAIIGMPLLVGTDGKQKMSQSLQNQIGILDKPEDKFGKIMSLPDHAMISYAQYLTDMADESIVEMQSELKKGANPRDIKMAIAYEVVKAFDSHASAVRAQEQFVKTFTRRETPEDIQTLSMKKKSATLIEMLQLCFAGKKSGSELRRLVAQGAVRVDEKQVTDIQQELHLSSTPLLLKVGKREWFRVTR